MEGIQVEDHSPTLEINRVHPLNDEPPAYEPPPDYEAPPNYEEAIKTYKRLMKNKYNNLKLDIESNSKFVLCITKFNNIIYLISLHL